MRTDQLQLTEQFPVSAETLFNAWLDSSEHSRFTGGEAIIRKVTGSSFTAWDKYISGKILEIENGRRILHSWRTTDFPKESPSSFLELIFEERDGRCQLTLRHWNIPDGQGARYRFGWVDQYFAPMKAYFAPKPIQGGMRAVAGR